jgi:trans-2,3-dihydro-3-hydroxyanthranilate isomerase
MLAQENLISLHEPITEIELEFNIGVLPVSIHVENQRPTRVVMTQQEPTFGQQFTVKEVAPCFDLEISDLRGDCLPQVVSTGLPFLIVPARDIDVLRKAQMRRDILAHLCDRANVSAVFMFSIGGFKPEVDTHARLFNPRGTMEDPFTGSASGAMGAYVVRYGLKPGPTLLAEQGDFVGRPGKGWLEILGAPPKITAVRLGGTAIRVLEGHFLIPRV